MIGEHPPRAAHFDAKTAMEFAHPEWRDGHRARSGHPAQPLALEVHRAQRTADDTGDVGPALAPVEARPAEPVRVRARQRDAELGEELDAARREHGAIDR